MGVLDQWGYAIAAAADEAGIEWCIKHEDGQFLYLIRLVDENGVPSRRLMTPGEFAAILDVPQPSGFAA